MAEERKTTPPTPPQSSDEWEKEFFKKHGITDESEQKAIRGRSTVFAYDRARRKAEEEAEKAADPNKGKKKWFEE